MANRQDSDSNAAHQNLQSAPSGEERLVESEDDIVDADADADADADIVDTDADDELDEEDEEDAEDAEDDEDDNEGVFSRDNPEGLQDNSGKI